MFPSWVSPPAHGHVPPGLLGLPLGSSDSRGLSRVSFENGQSAGPGGAGALPAPKCQTPPSPLQGRASASVAPPGPWQWSPLTSKGDAGLAQWGPQFLAPQVLQAPLLGQAHGAHGATHHARQRSGQPRGPAKGSAGELPEERGSRLVLRMVRDARKGRGFQREDDLGEALQAE